MRRLILPCAALVFLVGCATTPDVITVRDIRTRPVNMEVAWQQRDPPDRFGGFAQSLTTLGELAATAVQPWAGVAVAFIEMTGFLGERTTDMQSAVTEVTIPDTDGSVGATLLYDQRGQLQSVQVHRLGDADKWPFPAAPEQ